MRINGKNSQLDVLSIVLKKKELIWVSLLSSDSTTVSEQLWNFAKRFTKRPYGGAFVFEHGFFVREFSPGISTSSQILPIANFFS